MTSPAGAVKVRKLEPRPALHATRLLDQVRERVRYLHYSLRTEESYVYWVRFFIRFHELRHPREMGRIEVEAFLTMLATQRQVAAATHRQALSALLFLYTEVLGQQLPWLAEIGRPVAKKRIPSVLAIAEVERVLGFLEGELGLVARLLYGTGMRLMEGLSLRVKDIDLERRVIVVREGKGGKDRVVMLPASLEAALRQQLAKARLLWDADRATGRSGVFLPHARRRNPQSPGRALGSASLTLPPSPQPPFQHPHRLGIQRGTRPAAAARGRQRSNPGPSGLRWPPGTPAIHQAQCAPTTPRRRTTTLFVTGDPWRPPCIGARSP